MWLPVAMSTAALLVSAASFLGGRRARKHDLFLALWQEYGSPEMLDALMAVYRLWNERGGVSEEIAEEYVRRFSAGDLTLHERRRRVSLLFRKLAFLHHHRLIPAEFRRDLAGFDLDAIAVLHPIETQAMPRILQGEPQFPRALEADKAGSEESRRMFQLYNRMRGPGGRVGPWLVLFLSLTAIALVILAEAGF